MAARNHAADGLAPVMTMWTSYGAVRPVSVLLGLGAKFRAGLELRGFATVGCLVPGCKNGGRHSGARRKARTRNPRFFGTAAWIPGSRAAHPPRNDRSGSTRLGITGFEAECAR
jgi:hypothetical protein